MQAKKSLGQNFLIDNNKIKQIVNSLQINSDDFVFEVGPGQGALTFSIAKITSHLTAIEIDKELSKYLLAKITNNESSIFSLITGDILDFDFQLWFKENNVSTAIFVSNLPYYISTKILFQIISEQKFNLIGVMLQIDLVNRIFAKNNTREYGRLTVAINSLFELTDNIKVANSCFRPQPKINSAFIILKRKTNYSIPVNQQNDYLEFIRFCFQSKRKTLLNSLKTSDEKYYRWVVDFFEKTNRKLNCRAEQLLVTDFVSIWLNNN